MRVGKENTLKERMEEIWKDLGLIVEKRQRK